MKRTNSILALVLVLVMMLALGSTAYAAAQTYSITVENTNSNISIVGNTYTAYKLFNVTYSGDAYAYTVTDEFAGFTYTVEELDGDGYTVTVNGKEATSVSGTIEGNAVVKAAFNNYKAADTPDEPDDEEEVTETKAPATGDNSNTILWIIVAIVAVAALCGVAYSRKHMNKH